MQPYRATIEVCYVGQDDLAADDWWDRAFAALEGLGMTFPQGGHGGYMDPADVIPGSPLALALGQEHS
jgi:hypothetical protein